MPNLVEHEVLELGQVQSSDQIKVRNCGLVVSHVEKRTVPGILSIVEAYKEIPFLMWRRFVITDVYDPYSERGNHAHKRTAQALFCLQGKCKVHFDDCLNKQTFELNSECKNGLYTGPGVWGNMTDFSSDCVLEVLASRFYNEADYIRRRGDFEDRVDRSRFDPRTIAEYAVLDLHEYSQRTRAVLGLRKKVI